MGLYEKLARFPRALEADRALQQLTAYQVWAYLWKRNGEISGEDFKEAAEAVKFLTGEIKNSEGYRQLLEISRGG